MRQKNFQKHFFSKIFSVINAVDCQLQAQGCQKGPVAGQNRRLVSNP